MRWYHPLNPSLAPEAYAALDLKFEMDKPTCSVFWHHVQMRIPRSGDDLYDAVQPFAEAVKGYIQIAIGLSVMIALIHEWVSSTGAPLSEIADKALTLAGGGFALSAVVELAYTFFTRGPDEALDPLILGIFIVRAHQHE
jgi:hypothetical protein